jgi:hypothetical protein
MQLAVFPHASVATYVRTTEPVHGSPVNGLSLHVTVTGASQLSDTVTSAGPHGGMPVPHSNVTDGGQEIVGGVLSSTAMICVQLAVLPHSSDAV